jgi:uncharacterized membrane protein SirB2
MLGSINIDIIFLTWMGKGSNHSASYGVPEWFIIPTILLFAFIVIGVFVLNKKEKNRKKKLKQDLNKNKKSN